MRPPRRADEVAMGSPAADVLDETLLPGSAFFPVVDGTEK